MPVTLEGSNHNKMMLKENFVKKERFVNQEEQQDNSCLQIMYIYKNISISPRIKVGS